jgi:choline kinase
MKAIIVSAGQGKRLLPLTESTPKCLLPVSGERSLLEMQLRALARCGINDVCVMIGFGADQVERAISRYAIPGIEVRTSYNPFYALSDNLATVWMARHEMTEDFILINGDTLFEVSLLEQVLSSPPAPITVTINEKSSYDDDDMKVSLNGQSHLTAIGKKLELDVVDGESIGMLLFRGEGVGVFRDALERDVRGPDGLRSWYLSVIHALAQNMVVETACITGHWWGEVDSPEDLQQVRQAFAEREQTRASHLKHPGRSASI